MTIKNVIFDVGNVLVKWQPYILIDKIFPNEKAKEFYQEKIYPTWLKVNLGTLTQEQAINEFVSKVGLPRNSISRLVDEFTTHQAPVEGSIELLQKLRAAGIKLYSITDNTKETMQYHRQNSAFPSYFIDIICSADIGLKKPNPQIYQHLLTKHELVASECVFIDDLLANVEAARLLEIHAIHFSDTRSCNQQLVNLGINISY